ncbi:MAG: glycoside hydrolase family 2 protein [Bacteroidota bacterium]
MIRVLVLGVAALCAVGLANSSGHDEFSPYVLPAPRMSYDDGQDAMGSRLFATTHVRTQINLGGLWDFLPDPQHKGEAKQYYVKFPKPETSLWMPGTWNIEPRYSGYVGPAWMRRPFSLSRAGNLRLHFGGAFYRTKVWLDGEYLGGHEGGYTPFSFAVRNVKAGPHTLIVRVDNTLNDRTLPQRGVDWFPYGGIDRAVYAELVSDIWIERFHVIPRRNGETGVKLEVKALLKSLASSQRSEKLELTIDGRMIYSGKHPLGPGDSVVTFEAKLENPRLWSPENPNLYSARLVLGSGLDDQAVRFGVRWLTIEGTRILLNGKPLRLIGVNRHEDHPDWGSALPPQNLRQDVAIIKGMRANAVRGHYPPNELFLDYCDQAGLVFLNEIPAWQTTPEQLADPEVQQKIRGQFREMVERDMNHPSVLTWSLGNEWRNPDRCYKAARSLAAYARTLDSTRPLILITAAYVGRLQELFDIIATNWSRHEWYDPATHLNSGVAERTVRQLASIHERFQDKPVLLSEFGGAESQAGWHDWSGAKWSEEFQARNVADSGDWGLRQEWIVGGCVWQFADSRSAPERILEGRLRGWNAKGILDAYRRPKLAYYEFLHLLRIYGGPSLRKLSRTDAGRQ